MSAHTHTRARVTSQRPHFNDTAVLCGGTPAHISPTNDTARRQEAVFEFFFLNLFFLKKRKFLIFFSQKLFLKKINFC